MIHLFTLFRVNDSTESTLELLTEIDKIQGNAEKNYFQSALPNIPQHLVFTERYCKLKDYVKSIVDKVLCDVPQVVLTGAKGVGKSISLLTLALEMRSHHMLYFSSYSVDNDDILNSYLEEKLKCKNTKS